MEKLNFYTVDLKYVQYLKDAETKARGFTRVPNMVYGSSRKPKFLLGVVLNISGVDYYVPVTSYKTKMPDNFLIQADNGIVTSSLRFNYMFPIPKDMVSERVISSEPDAAYRALLSQELRFCIKHQAEIQKLAERTYKRVLLGKDPGLVENSCAFTFLEGKCKAWVKEHTSEKEQLTDAEKTARPEPTSVLARLHSLAATGDKSPATKAKPADRQHDKK